MRASDQDRQRAIDELRRHCAAGRIDVDEYASRIERALAASTLEELDEIRGDLPMLRVAEPAGGHGVWAGRPPRAALSPAGHAKDGGRENHVSPRVRLAALSMAATAVVVVLAVVALVLQAELVWAVMLLIGWAAGMAQGRLAGRNRRGP